MSGALILDGLALVGVAITTVPILADLFSPKSDSEFVTKVRLVAGDGDFTEGNTPHISLYDRAGNNIGFTGTHTVGFKDAMLHRGQPHDIEIEQQNREAAANGAEYLGMFTNGDNAVCVSIVTVTTPTGVVYNWLGDVAKQCGAPWFPGNVVASTGPKGEIRPACVWLDNDGTNGLKTTAVGIHLPSFESNAAKEEDWGAHPDRMCKSFPRFHVYEGLHPAMPLPYFVEPVYDPVTLVDLGDKALDEKNWAVKDNVNFPKALLDKLLGRRAAGEDGEEDGVDGKDIGEDATPGRSTGAPPKKSTTRPDHLVITAFGAHSAKEVCESASSWGPDLVHPEEGYYCDMESKTLWEVCKTKKQAGCFDMTTNSMRLGKMRRGDGTMVVPKVKKYTEVKRWS